jgi:hypothetical protein
MKSQMNGLACVWILVMLTTAVSVACAKSPFRINGVSHVDDPQLRNTVVTYYHSEAMEDWTTAYRFRSLSFRHLVPFEKYSREMQASNTGWSLEQVDIFSARCENGDCHIRIRFLERIAKSVAGQRNLGSVSKEVSVENTIWRLTNNKWYVLDAGTRNHLGLNANIADN